MIFPEINTTLEEIYDSGISWQIIFPSLLCTEKSYK